MTEVLNFIGFSYGSTKPVLFEIGHYLIVGVAARDYDPGPGIDLQEFQRSFLSAHSPGNGEVKDDGGERMAGFKGFLV